MSTTIYIAGPMRGCKYYNFVTFDVYKEYFENQGYNVISPADLDREHGFDPFDLPEDYDWNTLPNDNGFSFADCVKRDVDAVLECDVVFLLFKWENSKGATAEKTLAEWAGKAVWYETELASATIGTCNYEIYERLEKRKMSSTVWHTEGNNMHEVGSQNRNGNFDEQDQSSKPTNPKDAIGSKKAKVSTVPAGVMMKIGLAMLEGAVKYGRHNYRAVGVRSSIYYDAGVGHLFDWWEGQDIDPDSGLHHLDKALASLVVLRDAMLQDKLTDDRPPCSQVFKQDMNEDAKSLIERHSDKNPKHYTIKD